MSNLVKNIAWAILTLLIISVVFSFFLEPKEAPEKLSLNQLVARINSGAVAKIDVNGDELNIELADGKPAESKKEAEAGLSETLRNLGAEPAALAGVEISVAEEEGLDGQSHGDVD
ncbi:MAG: ATP-dependent metallopeptidase FtsH/Yme1/Tma family protein, partial [Patescibacteria group bacterium]